MKKKNKENRSPKKFLTGLLEVLGEIVLYAVFGAIGFGCVYLLGGSKLAYRLAEDEFIVLIGIAMIALVFGAVFIMVYYTKKLLRFMMKKEKRKEK